MRREISRRLVSRYRHQVDRLPMGELSIEEINLFAQENFGQFDRSPVQGKCFNDGIRGNCVWWKFNFGSHTPNLRDPLFGTVFYDVPRRGGGFALYAGQLSSFCLYWNPESKLVEVSFEYKMYRLNNEGKFEDHI